MQAQDFCFHTERGNAMENVLCKYIHSKSIETKY